MRGAIIQDAHGKKANTTPIVASVRSDNDVLLKVNDTDESLKGFIEVDYG